MKRCRDVVARDSKLMNIVVVQNSGKSGCKTHVTGVPVLSERIFHDGLSISMMERLLSATSTPFVAQGLGGSHPVLNHNPEANSPREAGGGVTGDGKHGDASSVFLLVVEL